MMSPLRSSYDHSHRLGLVIFQQLFYLTFQFLSLNGVLIRLNDSAFIFINQKQILVKIKVALNLVVKAIYE